MLASGPGRSLHINNTTATTGCIYNPVELSGTSLGINNKQYAGRLHVDAGARALHLPHQLALARIPIHTATSAMDAHQPLLLTETTRRSISSFLTRRQLPNPNPRICRHFLAENSKHIYKDERSPATPSSGIPDYIISLWNSVSDIQREDLWLAGSCSCEMERRPLWMVDSLCSQFLHCFSPDNRLLHYGYYSWLRLRFPQRLVHSCIWHSRRLPVLVPVVPNHIFRICESFGGRGQEIHRVGIDVETRWAEDTGHDTLLSVAIQLK